jgi:WD40 repeat protein
MYLLRTSYRVPVINIVFLCAAVLFLNVHSIAQHDQAVARAGQLRGPFGTEFAVTPDGLSTAYFGTEYPGAIYQQNIGSRQKRLILTYGGEYGDWDVVDSLDFSPDARSLLFEAGPARMFTGQIYTLHIDGSALKVLAGDAQLLTGTVTADPKIVSTVKGAFYDIGFSSPLYSPDGKLVLVTVNISNGLRDKQGRVDASQIRSYVGVILPDKERQDPSLLKELKSGERVLFWSSDGAGIYYSGEDSLVHRLDILTKQDTSIVNTRDLYILGRIPGTDFVLVRAAGTSVVRICSLNTNIPSPSLSSSVARIPSRDSLGRYLYSVKGAGPQRFLLTYKATFSTASSSGEHSEIMSLQ